MPEIDLTNLPNKVGVDLSGLPSKTPAPKLPIIAGTEGMELFSENASKINQKYKNAVNQSQHLNIDIPTAWGMEETVSKQLGNVKIPDANIPEVNLPYPRTVGPDDTIGQIANDLGLPVGEPGVLARALAIPFIPIHELLRSPGAVSEVELASIPEELEVKGSSILDFVEIGGQQLADKVFPGGYTAEDAGESLALDPEFAGQIARVAVDLGVGYLYAGAVIKTLGGIVGELQLQWRLLTVKERRLMLQTAEAMQESGMSEGQIFKALRNQGRTAEFNQFKDVAMARRQTTFQTAEEFAEQRAASLERVGVKPEVPVAKQPEVPAGEVAKVELARPIKPPIPEEAARFQPIPKEPIPIEEIDTLQKLSGEASRKALENIKAQDLKEEKKILSQARKEATRLMREQPFNEAIAEAIEGGGLDRATVIASGISPNEIVQINKIRPTLIRKAGGVRADVFANEQGFDTVSDLFEQIKISPKGGEQTEEFAQQLFDEAMIDIDEGRALDLRERILNEEIDVLKKMLGKKPKARKELKGIIRAQTGQVKVRDILEIDEAKALKDQIRLEAKAAREAFSAGKIESALKHKEKQRELTARARVRKQQRETTKKIIKDFKKVQKRLDPKKRKQFAGLPEAQAKPIRALLDDLDLAKPTKKTLSRLEGTRLFLEDNPEVTLPDAVIKKLDRLQKTSVRDLEFNELESIHQAVMHHVKLAENKNTIKVKREKREVNRVLTTAINELELPAVEIDKLSEVVDGLDTKRRSVGRLIVENLGIRQDGYDLIVESIAGPESVTYDILFKQVDAATRKQLETSQKFYDDFNEDLKKAGFKPEVTTIFRKKKVPDISKWGEEMVTVERFKLSRAQRVAFHRHSLNDDNRLAILEGGFGLKFSSNPNEVFSISEDELQAIIDSLDENELAFSRAAGNLFDDMGDQLNTAFERIYGYPMPRVENYFRKDVMPLERASDADSETEEFLRKFQDRWTRPGLEKGFLEARVGSTKPIYLNPVFDEINKSIDKASAFIALEEPLNNASKLLYNTTYRKGLLDKYEDDIVWKEIDKGLKDIAGLHESMSSFEKFLMASKDKLTSTIFGLNPFIIMLQPLSYPMYLRYISAENLFQAQLEFWQNPNKMIARHRRYSPPFRKRLEGGFNKDLAELAARSTNKELGGTPALAQRLTGGIAAGDMVSVAPGFQAAVAQTVENLNNGIITDEMRIALDVVKGDLPLLSAEGKIQLGYRFAEFATNLTQPTFSLQHRNPMSRGVAVEKVVSMFSSFTNRVLNMARRDWRAWQRAKTPDEKSKALNRFAQVMLLAGVVNTIGLIGRDEIRDLAYGRDDKKKKVILRVLRAWSGYLLIIRDVVNSGVSMAERGVFGYDVDYPTDKVLQIPANILASFLKMMTATDKKKKEKAAVRFSDQFVELIFLTKGLPYQNVKNLARIAAPKKKKKGIGGPK